MQTPRKRNGSSDVPKRTSPVTPRSRQTNVTGSGSDLTAPASPGVKASVSRSPKVSEHRSPRSPVTEKKRPNKVAELESQVSQLQENLKQAKDQLASAESLKKRAQKEAEDANNKFMAATEKLEDTQRQLHELSESEDARVQDLRKIGQDRDRAWQSELEAVQKQQSADSAALFSSMGEIQRLKLQLEMVTISEGAQAKQVELANSRLLALEEGSADTLSLIEGLKMQLKESEKTEEEQQMLVTETQLQLEMAKATIDSLRSDGLKALESSNALTIELADSRARVRSLEEILRELQEGVQDADVGSNTLDAESLRAELISLLSEIEQLRCALEAAEVKYQEEQVKCTVLIQSAYEAVEHNQMESEHKESELELMLKESKSEVSELKAKLINKEIELQGIHNLNERVNAEINNCQDKKTETDLDSKLCNVMTDVADLKAKLMDKEIELQNTIEENSFLKLEMEKKELERIKSIETAFAEVEIARSAEQEALVSVGIVTEESDKTSRRAARVSEQLQAVQTANSEMESELKRLRVQTEQWRKAAEAAAAILTTGSNGRLVERTGSLDSDYSSIAGKLLNSPFSDDADVESPKKKNNVLKKIGVLWKKNPK